jgi:organic hydroperoxide reductase OsmC/OhrA
MIHDTLQPTVALPKEADKERAERIIHKAEAACLISNSITSAIVFEPKVEVV